MMDPEEIILFIGGPYDGKRKRWGITHPSQKVLTMTLGEPLEDVYRLQRFQGRREYFIAVHEGVHDPMFWLLDGYTAKKK